jgi:CHRD domain/PEP-CTERM motif
MMGNMKLPILLTVIGLMEAIAPIASAQTFDANLDGFQVNPPNASPGFGSGDFSLSGTTFSVTDGSYQDLLGNSTAVTLNDAAVGTNGPLVFALTLTSPGTTSGTFSGSGTLTTPQITDLEAGKFYVNLRTNVYPSGEIRGQLSETPEPSTWALILGGLGLVAFWRMPRRRAS